MPAKPVPGLLGDSWGFVLFKCSYSGKRAEQVDSQLVLIPGTGAMRKMHRALLS